MASRHRHARVPVQLATQDDANSSTVDDGTIEANIAAAPAFDASALRRRCTGAALTFAVGVVCIAPPPMSLTVTSPSGNVHEDGLYRLGPTRGSSTHDLMLRMELAAPAAAVELPDQIDPWKEGRARKAKERAVAQQRVDLVFKLEAENRAENERLSSAYYAKAAAIRRARTGAERDNLPPAEVDVIAAAAGQRAFENAVAGIDDEAIELQQYESRQAELRRTAEVRNAGALASAAAAQAAAAAAAAEIQDELKLAADCVGADNPLIRPGSIQCT